MSRSFTLLALVLAAVCCMSTMAFTPVQTRSITFQPARLVPGSYNRPQNKRIFRMSEEPTEGEEEKKEAEVAADGTFYDDEVEMKTTSVGMSDSMKDKLRREASSGMDSNEKQTNVILYISVAVAILVLLGGQGILF